MNSEHYGSGYYKRTVLVDNCYIEYYIVTEQVNETKIKTA